MATVTASTLVQTRLVYVSDPTSSTPSNDNPLECSVHTLPKQLLREFRHVFREECKSMSEEVPSSLNDENSTDLVLLAIPTNQMAREDLVAIGDHIEAEKDRLLRVVSAL